MVYRHLILSGVCPLVVMSLTACGSAWTVEHHYRLWERYCLAAEHARIERKLRDAETKFTMALTQAARLGNREVAVTLAGLGRVQLLQDRPHEAESTFARARGLLVAGGEPPGAGLDDEVEAQVALGLAEAQLRLGKIGPAQPLFAAAANFYRKQLAFDITKRSYLGQELFSSLVGLAETARLAKKYRVAESLYQEAVKLERQIIVTGAWRDKLISGYTNLLSAQGREAEAGLLRSEGTLDAETIERRKRSESWYAILKRAQSLHRQDRYEEAIPLFEEAGEILQSEDPRSERLVEVLRHIGNGYKHLGELPRAKKALEEALAVHRRYHQNPVELARIETDLGDVYRRLNQPAQALELLKRADKGLGGDRRAAGNLRNLALLYIAERDYSNARRAASRLLGGSREDANPDDSQDAALLAVCCAKSGNEAQAQELFARSAKLARQDQPARRLRVARLRAMWLYSDGRFTEADRIAKEALESGPRQDLEVEAHLLVIRGEVAQRRGQRVEAQRFYEQALAHESTSRVKMFAVQRAMCALAILKLESGDRAAWKALINRAASCGPLGFDKGSPRLESLEDVDGRFEFIAFG